MLKRHYEIHARYLFLCMFFLSVLLPCHAWKVRTHIYFANLIIEELKGNFDGTASGMSIPFLTAPWDTREYRFRVSPEFTSAVLSYPEYFRAGAVGPDAFPDIYVGQSIIHPQFSNSWVNHLWEKRLKYPVEERGPITAFLLGFMIHAACDAFGHTFVNHYAGGPFPTVSNGCTETELKNIKSHIAVESIIDSNIPAMFKGREWFKIKAPKKFILNEMVFEDDASRNLNSIYQKVGANPEHLRCFVFLRRNLEDAAESLKPKGLDYITGTAVLKIATKAYLKAWICDIDEGLVDWIETSESVAQRLAFGENFETVFAAVKSWAGDHLLSMTGFPDISGSMIKILGSVEKLAGKYLGGLCEPINRLKNVFYNKIFEEITGISVSELNQLLRNPESYLGARTVSLVMKDLGNFSTETASTRIGFNAAYNSLVMSKLVMISAEIRPEEGRSLGGTVVPTAGSMDSTIFTRKDYSVSTLKDIHDMDSLPVSDLTAIDPTENLIILFPDDKQIVIPPPPPPVGCIHWEWDWELGWIPVFVVDEVFFDPSSLYYIPWADSGPNPDIPPIREGSYLCANRVVNFVRSLDGSEQWKESDWEFYDNISIFKALFKVIR